ncbi:MAG TPA: PPE domain-containing protein [Mycobacterium sp.]|nr:PPE domain-containing protein [Mycobacterium sp.]
MPDPRWMSPPEVVAATFETGPGPMSVLANQLVWITEVISHELMTGLSAANAASTATQWIGAGGAGSMQSVLGLNAGLQTLVGWVTHKVAVTQAAAEAFMLARSTVVPSVLAQANRDETLALHATNPPLFQNTPAIIAHDIEYFNVFWPHNSSIGTSYAGTLTGLTGSLGMPPPAAPMGASPAAPMMASTSAAESAAESAAQGGLASSTEAAGAPMRAASSGGMAGELGGFLQQGPQLLSGMTQPLQSFSSAPQSLMGMFSSMRPPGALGADAALAGAVAEPVRAGAGLTGGVGGVAGGTGAGGGYPGAALTSYTRPSSTFAPEAGGRPAGRAGVLNAAELRGPVTAGGPGGTPMPMSPAAGMLGRGAADGRDETARARIVAGPETSHSDPSGGNRR